MNSFDPSYGGGATTRCRVDPDDPRTAPGVQYVRDREWEDPNDDGRPTCRPRVDPPPRVDAAPVPGLPMTGPVTGAPMGMADAGAGDAADVDAYSEDAGDGGSIDADDAAPAGLRRA